MTPAELKQGLPVTEEMGKNIEKGRREIKEILKHLDERIAVAKDIGKVKGEEGIL